eukprot:TRINITY_DN21385_c0_g1_i1.p1 TRINITY_DN21385_c0_g1~~TRINITY_DN21385_c0_g1_i1.p1  ORF type:complete len:404 (-),score=33.92 TRINITY_DN21385_c0_g1_i1:630-1841(-)
MLECVCKSRGDNERSGIGRYFLAFAFIATCLVGIKMSSLEQHKTIYKTLRLMNTDTTRLGTSEAPIPSVQKRTGLVPFERQEGVVIVTKTHGPNMQALLDQSLCLLHHAYNHKPLYDIVVFTSNTLSDEAKAYTASLVAPAKLSIVLDNRGFQEEVAALSPERRKNFLKSCNASTPVNLSWWSECPGRVAYNWQAEFRSWHIWKHPALSSYKYMMWLDADAFSTKPWPQDPIIPMIENDLVIFFVHFPQGRNSGQDVSERIRKAFDVQLCNVRLVNGRFQSKLGPGNGSACKSAVSLVHGFFHITNLDFFRSDIVQRFAEIWIGDGFLQRRYDDQAAVTIPAAILAPNRSWDMRGNGIELGLYHNLRVYGNGEKVAGFKRYWKNIAKQKLPTADGVCPIKAAN